MGISVTFFTGYFEFLCRWAQFYCELHGLEKTGKNIRTVLGDLLFLVRFTLMSAREFMNGVMFENILTDDEGRLLMAYIVRTEEERFVQST